MREASYTFVGWRERARVCSPSLLLAQGCCSRGYRGRAPTHPRRLAKPRAQWWTRGDEEATPKTKSFDLQNQTLRPPKPNPSTSKTKSFRRTFLVCSVKFENHVGEGCWGSESDSRRVGCGGSESDWIALAYVWVCGVCGMCVYVCVSVVCVCGVCVPLPNRRR